MKPNSSKIIALWVLVVVSFIGLLYARFVQSETIALWIGMAVLLFAGLAGIVYQHRGDIKKEKAVAGASSFTTAILVIGILGVVNFLGVKYPKKLDLTKNRLNTLSDQTEKVVKGLKQPLKLVLFGKPEQQEELKPLMDNFRTALPSIQYEAVDPMKEASRAQLAEIKNANAATLQVNLGERKSLVEAPTEEKILNTLIKLSKTTSPKICNVLGHGEKSFGDQETNGYSAMKTELERQAYSIVDLNLVQTGKIPEDCNAITVLGPVKALFDQETKLIREYLNNGGRAIIAIDLLLKSKGGETSPELVSILKDWGIQAESALIIDPVSRALNLEPTVPIAPTFSMQHPITADMSGNVIAPLSRPLTIQKTLPPNVAVEAIASTTPNAWGERDMKSLESGTVKFDSNSDIRGPMTIAAAVQGKKAGAKDETRFVVFATSYFAANQFARFDKNTDLFANSLSWVVGDDNLISIRPKDAGGGLVQLSQKAGIAIFLTSVIVVPLLLAIAGIVVWRLRKRL